MPEGGEKAMCCVWETKIEMTRAGFHAWVSLAMYATATTPDSFFEKGSLQHQILFSGENFA